MKSGTAWKKAARVAVCMILLGWIFHSIFLQETERSISPQSWAQLTAWQRNTLAWFKGPALLEATFAKVRLGPFALSLLFMGGILLVGIVRWRKVLLAQGLALPFSRAAEISLVAHFFNSFLLGSTGGDLLKAYYAARETHHKKTEAVLTVLVDRALGLWSMLLFACAMMIPNLGLLARHARLAALAWLIFALLAAGGAAAAAAFWGGPGPLWRLGLKLVTRLPKGHLVVRGAAATREFGHQRGALAEIIFLSMALNLLCILQIKAVSWGLGMRLEWLPILVIVPVVVCLSALPITPSGLGVRENLYVWMLTVPEIGADGAKALALSLLAYAGSLLWSIVGGLVYLARKERDHLPEIERAPE